MCNITGNKPSQLTDPDIALSNGDWVVLELTNGKVVRVHPSQIVGISGVLTGAFYFVQQNFSGQNLPVPIGINGGKLPTNLALMDVKTDGIDDYPILDFTVTYGAGAAVDTIVFTNARVNANILVKFQKFS